MRVTEIAFVGYPVTDLKRARNFYEGVLGLKASHVWGDENTAFIEYDIGAGTLAIGNGAPDWQPFAGGGSAALEVEDFNQALRTLRQFAAPIRLGPIETPVCHMAVVSDPDGNLITIHHRKRPSP